MQALLTNMVYIQKYWHFTKKGISDSELSFILAKWYLIVVQLRSEVNVESCRSLFWKWSRVFASVCKNEVFESVVHIHFSETGNFRQNGALCLSTTHLPVFLNQNAIASDNDLDPPFWCLIKLDACPQNNKVIVPRYWCLLPRALVGDAS